MSVCEKGSQKLPHRDNYQCSDMTWVPAKSFQVFSKTKSGMVLYLDACSIIGVEEEEEVEVRHERKEGGAFLVANVRCQCIKVLCKDMSVCRGMFTKRNTRCQINHNYT